jgi:metallo-beta-lactamase family protein
MLMESRERRLILQLSFHGADRGVTGSCHMVGCAGRRVLVDCGMFQGSRELDDENAEPFGFEPGEIDYLLLTHAHLDHCGRIPLLVKRGFRGEIITTAATRELARLVMLDAAHLHEEEARHRARKRNRSQSHEPAGPPLYTILDALNSLDCFGRTAAYDARLDLAPGIAATFVDAGHILGSASILLELSENGVHRRVLFSGDLGNGGRPLLRDPVVPSGADTVVMETTYGDRLHRPIEASVIELHEAVADALARGGNVIIPTFALERAQEVLFYLRQGIQQKRLPDSLTVFLDSPMAISATEIFERHPECYEPQVAELFREGRDPFHLPRLHFVRETAESIALNEIRSGALIMAGSGMCTGGRIRHHLRHNLSRSECSVIFVGFAAKGTLARRIIDGAQAVEVLGEMEPVRARIHTINGFSAHADQRELLEWHRRTGLPAETFLVHGEPATMQHLAGRLGQTRVHIPELNQYYDL